MSDREEIKKEPENVDDESSKGRLFSTQDISDLQQKLEDAVQNTTNSADDDPPEVSSALAQTQEALKAEVDKDLSEKKAQSEEKAQDSEIAENTESQVDTGEFEDKVDKAMQKIVADTAGEEPVSQPIQPVRPYARYRAMRGIPEPARIQGKAPYKMKKKYKGLKIAGITTAMLVVLAGCVYGAGTYYFSNKFFVGTSINGIDCSQMTASEVENMIARKVEN